VTPAWAAEHPGQRRCDVIHLPLRNDCAGVSVRWFTAQCPEGHKLKGGACGTCTVSEGLCCGSCFDESGERVPVTVTFERLAVLV
jgi:hypothetical protein